MTSLHPVLGPVVAHCSHLGHFKRQTYLEAVSDCSTVSKHQTVSQGSVLTQTSPKRKRKFPRSLDLGSQTVLSYHVGGGTSEGATSVPNL